MTKLLNLLRRENVQSWDVQIADKEQIKLFGKAETNLPYEQVEKICNNVLQLDKNCIEHFNIKKDYTPIKKQG